MIVLRITPLSPLKKGLLPSIPSYLVYLLDFFLRYKHHSKWLFDVCRRVIRITGLWSSGSCVVFAWIGRLLNFYSISGTKVPACVGENSGIPVWSSFFFFFEAQFNDTVFYLPYFKFVSLQEPIKFDGLLIAIKISTVGFFILLRYDAMCANIGIFLFHWITL